MQWVEDEKKKIMDVSHERQTKRRQDWKMSRKVHQVGWEKTPGAPKSDCEKARWGCQRGSRNLK